MYCPATPPPTRTSIGSISLTPSDSASQGLAGNTDKATCPLDSPASHPLVCPSHLPVGVLWTQEDLATDPLIKLDPKNKSRWPMHRAIRHEDGTPITRSQWRVIRASAAAVALSRLTNLISSDPRAADLPRKKKYFKAFFPKEWDLALTELEVAAPLLILCTGKWKADTTLGIILSDGLVLPSQSSSSQSPLPRPSSVPEPSRRQAEKATMGSKSKRAREPSPQRRVGKKAKVADREKSQPPPLDPAFLNITRATASVKPRARPKVDLKGIVMCPASKSIIVCCCILY